MSIDTQDIFSIQSESDFETLALKVFQHQMTHNEVYREYVGHLNINTNNIKSYRDIPFLPIEFFKSHKVISSQITEEKIFTSSGTTGSIVSQHYVSRLNLYEQSFQQAFENFYGDATSFCILALLPSYLERGGSSLVYMCDRLIKQSQHSSSGFYLNNLDELICTLKELESKKQATILLGVSYALLDLIEKERFQLKYTIVMETGGMKGKRKEMVKEELHKILANGFGLEKIHSEYGMTELLSQAYSTGDGIYNCPPWMKVLIRDPNDPLSLNNERTGGINVIDLANLDSCAFIATQDMGQIDENGSFRISGRFDQSDVRGCNLMVI